MEGFTEILFPIEFWHWVALGLMLLGIELLIGTYDLLWISAAAFATALITGLLPASIMGAEIQFLVFSVMAIGFILVSRTMLSSWREQKTDRPLLNQRMQTMIGRQALVTQSFKAGSGRVKIGDTEWLAYASEDENFHKGRIVIVDSIETTAVRVVAPESVKAEAAG